MKEKIELTTIKLGLLGNHSVGKTSICKVFKGLEFDEGERSTIGTDRYEKKFKLKNGNEIKVNIIDIAGHERYRYAVRQAIKHVHGIIIIFDVTDRISFDSIDTLFQGIKGNCNQPSLVLFGNKADRDKKEWRITNEEIESLSKIYNLKYFLTSAKTNMNINEGFDYIINNSFTKIKEKIESINLNNINDDNRGCIGKNKNNNKQKKSK